MDLLVAAAVMAGLPCALVTVGVGPVVVAQARSRGWRVGVVLLALASLGSAAVVWQAWGSGFDAADGLREEPSWVDPTLQGGALAWTLTTVALGFVVVAAHRRRRAVDRTRLDRPGTMES
ncbi:hypothetical protein [Aeromicrobium sp. CnD17-E]|uniref:hypothetical protein n=1 Tax=Aeromicrobium sp. CnD17-E TaxID=2954487 RepID=UPI0020972D9F|nr:hypothetical protein [Aeromicrobium sp. CnD17-E]MCO7239215.1 hypothetical protein [Aeromicrobium sp. CnD17-E]